MVGDNKTLFGSMCLMGRLLSLKKCAPYCNGMLHLSQMMCNLCNKDMYVHISH